MISVLTFQIWIDDAKSSKGFAKAIFTTANYTLSALVIVHFRVGVRLLILVMKSIYLTSAATQWSLTSSCLTQMGKIIYAVAFESQKSYYCSDFEIDLAPL